MKMTEKNIGKFEVVSNTLLVSDPCYKSHEWCNFEVKGVHKGTWVAKILIGDCKDWGKRVGYLMACHKDYKMPAVGSYKWHLANENIGVDSGQAGIYDIMHYKNDNVVKRHKGADYIPIKGEGDKWYAVNCLKTREDAGVIPFGCVSSSGFGDGCYTCWTWKANRKVAGIVIKFHIEE